MKININNKMNFIKKLVSGKKLRHKEGNIDLDLSYITPRIIAMSYPASAVIQKLYRNTASEVERFLR